jgi:hypothetical protein
MYAVAGGFEPLDFPLVVSGDHYSGSVIATSHGG